MTSLSTGWGRVAGSKHSAPKPVYTPGLSHLPECPRLTWSASSGGPRTAQHRRMTCPPHNLQLRGSFVPHTHRIQRRALRSGACLRDAGASGSLVSATAPEQYQDSLPLLQHAARASGWDRQVFNLHFGTTMTPRSQPLTANPIRREGETSLDAHAA